MNTKAPSQILRPVQYLAVLVVLLFSSERSHAQHQGSRPIEFSESRDQGVQQTNDQEFGAERRRLTDLEDRLSKTFNFFDSEDSLGGAPAPRLTRRPPVISKRAKPKGIFDEDNGDWTSSDPLDRLRHLIESDGPTADQLDPANPTNAGDDEPSLLNSLKTDDWLVKGTMSDSFWEMPLTVNQGPEEYSLPELSTTDTEQSESTPSQNWAFDNELRPRLEGVMGWDASRGSLFANQQEGGHLFTDENAFGVRQPSRSTIDARQEEYRALLGMAAQPSPWQPTGPMTTGNAGRFPDPYTPPSLTRGNVRAESQQSLYSTRSAYHDSLYPSAPTPPERPGMFNPIEVEQSVNSSVAPSSILNNPFYRASQRGF